MNMPADSIALGVDLCVFQQRNVAVLLSFGLFKLNLKRTRIDFCDQVTGRNHLSFPNGDSHEFSINTRSDCDGFVTHDGAETRQVNGLISRLCVCCNNSYRCGNRWMRSFTAVAKREIRDNSYKSGEHQPNP